MVDGEVFVGVVVVGVDVDDALDDETGSGDFAGSEAVVVVVAAGFVSVVCVLIADELPDDEELAPVVPNPELPEFDVELVVDPADVELEADEP